MQCNQNGTCYNKKQEQTIIQNCGRGGTQTRACSPTCDGGSCQGWGQCTGPTCLDSEKPKLSEPCGNCGIRTRSAKCNSNTGNWDATAWGSCTGQSCDASSKPSLSQGCGNCGTQTRTVDCNSNTGSWSAPSAWRSCSGQGECSPGATQGCGSNGTKTCGSSCSWGICAGERFDCSGPASQSCGKCGTQSRTCNTSTGNWNAWGSCGGEGSYAPNAMQSCGGGNGTQSCSASCGWNTCNCNSGYIWNGSTCVLKEIDCAGSAQQSCGKCGTQTRTCDRNTGNWGAWNFCSGQGTCTLGQTQSCTVKLAGVTYNGKATCSSSCSWGNCVKTGCVEDGCACVNGAKTECFWRNDSMGRRNCMGYDSFGDLRICMRN